MADGILGFKRAVDALRDAFAGEANRRSVAMAPDEVARRTAKVLKNDYGDLIDEALQAMFSPENYSHLRLHLHTATNVLARVVGESALVYQEPATRYLKGVTIDDTRATANARIGDVLRLTDEEIAASEGTGAAPPEEEEPSPARAPVVTGAQRAFEAYLRDVDLDALMDEVQRNAMVQPVLWIFPAVRRRDDGSVGLDFDVHTRYTADVILDPANATRAVAWYAKTRQKDRNGTERTVYYKWTATTISKHDADWKEIRDGDPIVGDGVNRLGRLPVVPVRLGRPLDSYYLDGMGLDLFDATIEACVLRTLQNARFRDSSFKQLAIDGRPDEIPADQVMGNPARPIFVPEGTVSVLDLQTNLDALSAVVRERILDVVVGYGFSPTSWTMSAVATSGYAKKLDQSKILARNRRHRKWLAAAERDLYSLVALGVRKGVYQIPALAALDPAAEYVVDFAEPAFEEDGKVQAEADGRNVVLGKLSVLDLVMRDNPDLTEEEALALLARNRLINARFGGISDGKKKGASVMEILAGVKQAELAFERVSQASAAATAPAANSVLPE